MVGIRMKSAEGLFQLYLMTLTCTVVEKGEE